MANIRGLKRDIDYLIEELLSDCYLVLHFQPEKQDKIVKLMEKSVALRNTLFDRVNTRPNRKDGKETKAHFKSLREDLFSGIDSLFSELSAVNK